MKLFLYIYCKDPSKEKKIYISFFIVRILAQGIELQVDLLIFESQNSSFQNAEMNLDNPLSNYTFYSFMLLLSTEIFLNLVVCAVFTKAERESLIYLIET